ncbi:MAG TPA: transglycosylase domain-containing protein [Pseudolabrys sp.]|nr:transglycosylase domain-containing protein [Pseudolabrys sp.]
MGFSSRLPRLWRLLIAAAVVLFLVPYAITPLYAVINPISTVMLWRYLSGARVDRIYVPLSRISPAVPLAVVIAEDGRFCTHHGVDLAEIREAMTEADDLQDMRGGSTITQQVAKNLFLWQGHSVVRKALEFPLALWIDLVLPKRRIMEIYLNIAQWGPHGEFGVEAGARRAFGKSAREVNGYQAALLAAMLPNPIERNARQPGPGLRRLAGLYVARASKAPAAVSCLRQRH